MNPKKTAFLLPSTRDFFKEGRRAKDFSFFDFVHGYIYGRFPYFYISVGTGNHPLAKVIGPVGAGLLNFLTITAARLRSILPENNSTTNKISFADTYHGKVVPLQAAVQLVKVQEEIRITDLEKIIPYARARDIILQNPDHIVALECPCRVARPNPCLPLDVCLIIGEPFATFVSEHHPSRSRWINQDEAVEILQAEDQRGHVHHAFFKDAMLGRFYAICNCCDCCCGAMQAHRSGTPMLASSGFYASINPSECKGCGICAKSCQFHAITIIDNGKKYAHLDPEKCMGCGICVNHCSRNAIELQRDPARGEPLEIHKLIQSSLQ